MVSSCIRGTSWAKIPQRTRHGERVGKRSPLLLFEVLLPAIIRTMCAACVIGNKKLSTAFAVALCFGIGLHLFTNLTRTVVTLAVVVVSRLCVLDLVHLYR